MDFKFLIIDISLDSQHEFIFVNNSPMACFLKNPIPGSNTIFSFDIPIDLARQRL